MLWTSTLTVPTQHKHLVSCYWVPLRSPPLLVTRCTLRITDVTEHRSRARIPATSLPPCYRHRCPPYHPRSRSAPTTTTSVRIIGLCMRLTPSVAPSEP